MLKISWPRAKPSGWVDYIPISTFSKIAVKKKMTHLMVGPGGRSSVATFRLTVRASTAVLDYAVCAPENNGKAILGQLRVQFSDSKRQVISAVLWKDHKKKAVYSSKVLSFTLDEEDTAALEGRRKLVVHLRSERNSGLVRQKRVEALAKHGALICEVCAATCNTTYGAIGDACYEVHHKSKVANGKRVTKLSDLAILCANCHRAIHRSNPMLTISKMRTLVGKSTRFA